MEVKGSIDLFRPGGGPVGVADADALVIELSSGRVYTISPPSTGVWKLDLSGSGAFSVAASGNSSLRLNSFSFVEFTGRPAHEGLFPIQGQPIAGETHTGLASLLGDFSTATWALVSESGDTVTSLNLTRGDPNASADEFVGTLTLPNVPFRVVVSGSDPTGSPFQRLYPTLFRVQTVKVTPDPFPDSLPIGRSTLTFSVQNAGAGDTFRISAADNFGFVSTVQPSSLSLGAGAAASVSVTLAVPSTVTPGATLSLTLTATSMTNPAVTNSAAISVKLSGVTNHPPIANAGIDRNVECVAPLTSINLDASASSDPDGDVL